MAEKETKKIKILKLKDRIKRFTLGSVLAAGLVSIPSYAQEQKNEIDIQRILIYTRSQLSGAEENDARGALFSYIYNRMDYYRDKKEIDEICSRAEKAANFEYSDLLGLMNDIENIIKNEKDQKLISALKILQSHLFFYRIKYEIRNKLKELEPELEKKDQLIEEMNSARSVLILSELIRPAMEYDVDFSYKKQYYRLYFSMMYGAIEAIMMKVALTGYANKSISEINTPCIFRDRVIRDFSTEKSFISIAEESKHYLSKIEKRLLASIQTSIQNKGKESKAINKIHKKVQDEFMKYFPAERICKFLKYEKDLPEDVFDKIWREKSMDLQDGVKVICDVIRRTINKRIEISIAMLPKYQKYIEEIPTTCKDQPLWDEIVKKQKEEEREIKELAEKFERGEDLGDISDEKLEKIINYLEKKKKNPNF